MIELRVANGCGPTGRVLKTLLEERGLQINGAGAAQGIVCYGHGNGGATRIPTLNARAGMLDKFQQFQAMKDAGVRTVPFFTNREALRETVFPMFGRKLNHTEGKDILVALQAEDVPMRVAAGAQFFTRYIPLDTEYRIWVYRRRHLAMYEKRMAHPEQYKYFGRAYRNGFAFGLVDAEAVPRDATALAAAAIEGLRLDFGAVDMLRGKDGNYYVLEVNTAPGVEGPGRQGIRALAGKISTWVEGGYKRRNGDTA